MKTQIKTSIIAAISIFLYGCYEHLEVDTAEADKIEIPVKIATPTMDGKLLMKYDDFLDFDSLGNSEFMTYENGLAFFKYDTLIDFYAELDNFLDMDKIDFSNSASYEESVNLNFDMPDVAFNYMGTTISLNPQDEFRDQYGGNNALFIMPNEGAAFDLEIAAATEDINLNLPIEVYRVDMASGVINIGISHSALPAIADEEMHLNYPPLSLKVPIYKGGSKLPGGVRIGLKLKIGAIKDNNGQDFEKNIMINTLDTAISIDLAGHAYEGNNGDFPIEIATYIQAENPKDTAIVPLPDRLNYLVEVKDINFEKATFNYGREMIISDSQGIDFKLFDDLPTDFNVEGFKLLNPYIALKLKSNLGLPVKLHVKALNFSSGGTLESILNGDRETIDIALPTDPNSSAVKVAAREGSLILDANTSRIDEISIFDIRGLQMNYDVEVNPDDEAGESGKHNFFYHYPLSKQKDMYDVKMAAEVRVPFEFYFENLSFKKTFEAPLKSTDLDSAIRLDGQNKAKLNVKILSKDFPFSGTAQFYFDKVNKAGDLEHLDSMFSDPRELVSAGSTSQWDSVQWSVEMDNKKFEHFKEADSLTMNIRFSMDEGEYFRLEENGSCEVAYQIKLDASTFIYTNE